MTAKTGSGMCVSAGRPGKIPAIEGSGANLRGLGELAGDIRCLLDAWLAASDLTKVPPMKALHDSLILALVLLAMPALAAAPKRPAAKPPAEAPAPVYSATDLIGQAQAAQANGDKDLAVRLAQAAIVADPARPATYVVLGDLYAANGDADYARFYYGEALAIDPADVGATKAMAALEHGDSQRAAKADTSAK
jgi:tetratricopeptide (TPR) repeat protein